MTQAQEASAKIATRRKAPKQLRFRDLLFILFGGQAPLISMLTFGTAMIALAGSGAALAMIIATTIVSVTTSSSTTSAGGSRGEAATTFTPTTPDPEPGP